jgi:hypothetical protein
MYFDIHDEIPVVWRCRNRQVGKPGGCESIGHEERRAGGNRVGKNPDAIHWDPG